MIKDICIICGEEIEKGLWKRYGDNPYICDNCDREQFEDSIGYEL